MKNKTNKILLLLCIASFVLYVALVLVWLEIVSIGWDIPTSTIAQWALYFPVVPFFLLQLLLCRVGKKKWIKALPLAIILGIVLACAISYIGESGWGALGWLIVLLLCVAPIVGCVVGLVAGRIFRKM